MSEKQFENTINDEIEKAEITVAEKVAKEDEEDRQGKSFEFMLGMLDKEGAMVDKTIDKMGGGKVVEEELDMTKDKMKKGERKWSNLEDFLKRDIELLREDYDKPLIKESIIASIKEKIESYTVNEKYMKDFLDMTKIEFTKENKKKLSDLALNLYGNLLEELKNKSETEPEKTEEKLTLELMSQNEIEKMSAEGLKKEIERVLKTPEFGRAKRYYEAEQKGEILIDPPAKNELTEKWREQNKGKFENYNNYLKMLEKERTKKESEIISEEERQREAENLEGKKIAQESRDKMWNRVTRIGKEIADNPEMPIEDREKIEDERSMETVSSIMSEVNLASYEKNSRKRREMLEAAYVAMKISLSEQEIKVGEKTAELTEAKTEAVNKFGIVSEKGVRKVVSKKNNQQTGEAKEKWYNRGLLGRVFGDKAEENENDEEKFNEDKFKNAVLAKYLEILGVTNKEKLNEHLDKMKKKDKEEGKQMDLNIKEKNAKKIAESLFDEYGEEKTREDLIKIIKEFGFTQKNIKEAVEKMKIDEIPKMKGFRELVKEIENVEDLDKVIEHLDKIKKMLNTEEKKEKVDALSNLIKYYRDNVMSEDEGTIKKVKEELQKSEDYIENFKSVLLKKEGLKELFEKIEGLCEKGKLEKEFDTIFSENETKTIKESASIEKMFESIEKVATSLTTEFTNNEIVDNKILDRYVNLLASIPSNFKMNGRLRGADEGYIRDAIDKSKNDNAKKYFGALLEKVGEFIDIESGRKRDDEEDLGEGENGKEITDEMREKIKERLEELKRDDRSRFDGVKDFAKSFSGDERLFGVAFEKTQFDSFVGGDINLSYDKIKGYKISDFMKVLEDVYEEVKNEEKKEIKIETGKISEKLKKKIRKKIENIDDKNGLFKGFKDVVSDYHIRISSDKTIEEVLKINREFGKMLELWLDIKPKKVKDINARYFIETVEEIYDEVKKKKETKK